MMVSTVRYPSFKSLGLRSHQHVHEGDRRGAVRRLHLVILREKILYYVLPAFFTLYLVYGFVRPSLSRAWRREIEEEDDEPDDRESTMSELPPILHRRARGLCRRAAVFRDARRAGQPHHHQRRRAARIQMGDAHRPRRVGDGGDLLHDLRSPAFPLFLEAPPSGRSWRCSASFSFCFSAGNFFRPNP